MKIKIISGVAIGIIAAAAAASMLDAGVGQERSVRVSYFANVGHIVPIAGLERGAFQDELNQTRIEQRLFDSGPQTIESMFAESVDLAYVGPGPAINGFIRSQDRSIVVLAGAASGGASLVSHPDSDLIEAGSLAGMTVAAPQIANTQDVSLRHYLAVRNLQTADRGGSVHVLNLPNPEIYSLFAKGDIDAAWVPEPWATILVNQLNGTRVFQEEELWPDGRFASVLLVGREAYVRENPDIVEAWLSAHDDTVLWINQNPQEARSVFTDHVERLLGSSFPEDIVAEALSNIEITSDPVPDSIATFAERADSLGYLGRDGYSLDGMLHRGGM